ncbi:MULTISPECIES: Cdc6/Cdc18 family protein [Halobacterium]|uniref:Cdc6/Cdc18 family protein n=1 Tax=Halobacterium TaxID=2239 RepID=UPI002556E7CE|nr:orc1/cdc6 family replication initiation protein [Halobacterium salinarum]MDL0126374.1 orc1/cdc6 family replication initiation protein [Halobacterium salinarum]MDL0141765.1 orc1/cdc6 family replication initiation protein [Halobacterium salinarum]
MSDRLFERGNTPFADRDALSDHYTPDDLVGRDAEIKQYTNYLEPAVWGEDPNNIFVYGKTGVGKTATTRYLLDNLERDTAEYDDTNISSLHINCDGLSTSYRVAITITNELREPHNQISESGHSTSEVYNRMWEAIDNLAYDPDKPDRTNIVLLVLDEVDHTETGEDSILYQLSRAGENNTLEHARIGVIGISNDLTFASSLSPKVESSLCQKKLFFDTYDANELQEVLRQRAEIAFKDDALRDGVIPHCAAYGRRQSGDAREALDLLRAAGDIARNEGLETVREEHVEQGIDRVQREEVIEGIRTLHEHSQYCIYALATLEAEGATPSRTRGVYERYELVCQLAGVDSLTSRRVRDFLRELSMLGAVETHDQNKGKGGGQFYEFELAHPLETMVTALDDMIEDVGMHSSIEEYT